MQEMQSHDTQRRQLVNHLPQSFSHWCRQHDRAQVIAERDKVYEISQIPKDDPTARPEPIAFTSKSSAQRLIAGLATQEGPYRFRITGVFLHPVLPGMEMER